MFRKKKNVGAVEFLEHETAEASNAGEFDDLGLKSFEAKDAGDNVDELSVQQLEALAIGTAESGKQSTARALKMATEAREVGVNTAEAMQTQTAQLEKMSEDIEVVHDYLDKSEHIIDKMSKPFFSRVFLRKKNGGKGLNKFKPSRKDQEARDDIRDKGIDGLDIGAMNSSNKGAITMNDLDDDRDQLLNGQTVSTAKKGWRGRKTKEVTTVKPREIREDYSQYSEPVAEVMRKQDDDLDQISDALTDMQALAGAMNNELEYQDKLINDVQGFTAETSRRTKENAKKIKRIK